MKGLAVILWVASFGFAGAAWGQNSGAGGGPTVPAERRTVPAPGADSLLTVKRIYVAPLTGGAQAEALRDLIITSLDATKLFVITDNEARADAVLKGAADDHTFTDTFDSDENVNGHTSGSSRSGGSIYSGGGIAATLAGGGSESHHIKERKHEAYAAVRLCNQDGDVLWSTTQESLGAKFRGASADVAAKIARQLTLDVERVKRGGGPEPPRP
jgi:hypothetical protein